MSLGIYPIFDRDFEGAELQSTGEGLALNFEAIDTIADAAKLTPLSAFADNREIPENFDGDPDELADLMGECDEWYDTSLGQSALQAIADHIKGNHTAARRLEEPSWVVNELEELSRVLGVAAKNRAKFRLEMS